MIIKKDKSVEMNSMFPNGDWYEEGNYVIDETKEENLELIQKVNKHAPYMELIIENEVVVDVLPLERPIFQQTEEEINQMVIDKIRQQYSIDEEFKMQRLGLLDNNDANYQIYLQYVNTCIQWGSDEKEKLG